MCGLSLLIIIIIYLMLIYISNSMVQFYFQLNVAYNLIFLKIMFCKLKSILKV